MFYLVLFYCLLLVIGMIRNRPAPALDKMDEFTVIIPFRDEEGSLPGLLLSLKKEWTENIREVVFVNDHSSDNSVKQLETFIFENQNLNIRLLHNEAKDQGKKKAIELAWSSIDHSRIIQLDADVILSEGFFTEWEKYANDFTTGLVKVRPRLPFSFFWKWENVAQMFITKWSIDLGVPLMANGANLSYRKVKDIDLKNTYSSGDDLFVMYDLLENGGDVRFNVSSFVLTDTPASFKKMVHQRLRWSSKAFGVKNKGYLLLSFLVVLMQLVPIVLLFWFSWSLLFMVLLKLVLELIGMLKINRELKFKGLMWTYPLVVLLYPIYVLFLLLCSFWVQPTWKGRNIVTRGNA